MRDSNGRSLAKSLTSARISANLASENSLQVCCASDEISQIFIPVTVGIFWLISTLASLDGRIHDRRVV